MSKFSGMSKSQCPAGCNVDRCLITLRAHCGHPCLQGIQTALKSQDVLANYAEACKAIGVQNKHEVAR
jgi:hypothetical protein